MPAVPTSLAPTDPPGASLAGRIDALLPQTQCTRCGYPSCRAYADAIAADLAERGTAAINQCPPGGERGIERLAALLGVAAQPLNPDHGIEAAPRVARVIESRCIGCTKCIQACPVDAIIGAAKRMHAVLADECSGCDLCLPACPVDCIEMLPAVHAPDDALMRAPQYRQRYVAHLARLARDEAERDADLAARKASVHATPATSAQDAVQDAIARARARRAQQRGGSA